MRGGSHETYAQRALRKIPHESRTIEQIAADAAAMIRREQMRPEDYNSILEESDRIALRQCCVSGRPNTKKAAEFMARLIGERLVLDMIYGMLVTLGESDDAAS